MTLFRVFLWIVLFASLSAGAMETVPADATETVTPEMVVQARKDIFSNKRSAAEKQAALELLKKGADQKLTEAEYWYAWMRFYGKGGKTFYIIRPSRI